MTWIDFRKDKTSPKDGSWVVISTSMKNTPKYEVCRYKNGEWYIPSYDDSCDEKDIKKWAYIEE